MLRCVASVLRYAAQRSSPQVGIAEKVVDEKVVDVPVSYRHSPRLVGGGIVPLSFCSLVCPVAHKAKHCVGGALTSCGGKI